MQIKRILQIAKWNLTFSQKAKQKFLRKTFYECGDFVDYNPKVLPLYPKLVKFHNNIIIASGVHFITHDAINFMINRSIKNGDFKERIGCVEIEDNVFIGAHSTILYNVKIGSNVIVGANSVVNKDLESNYVYAGVPARKICTFDQFMQKRGKLYASVDKNQIITDEEVENAWALFNLDRHQ